jgi:alanine racemase
VNPYRPTLALIDLEALRFNLAQFSFYEKSFLCPMVKANAYGHGAVEITNFLFQNGVRQCGVGLIEEGLQLRRAGLNGDLLMFGMFDAHACPELLRLNLIPVLSSWSEIHLLEKYAKGRTRIHLKFDTGMHRLGFALADHDRLWQHLHHHPTLQVDGICTHLLRGEDLLDDSGRTQDQLRKFALILPQWQSLSPAVKIHSFNTASALLNMHVAQHSPAPSPSSSPASTGAPANSARPWGARPGLGLYGYDSRVLQEAGSTLRLKPVMSLVSKIVRVRDVPKGETVSYNGTWQASRDSVVGVVPMGYADGYIRVLSNRGQVLFRGQKVPVIGNVCMDYFMVDLTEVARGAKSASPSTIQENEDVVLMGEQNGQRITAEDIAAEAGTISFEILTRISTRVHRVLR